jgi:hypothetical protein
MDEFMVLRATDPVWLVLDHYYHDERDMHGMVLVRHTDYGCGDTMIYTIGKWH